MDPIIANYLREVELEAVQAYQNMAVLPLLTSSNGSPQYLTLKEALDAELITITEVDQSGSVPDLKVINPSTHYVLLLDGEELMGAKQNRVLNTSILLRGHSETIIPVSCTEAGRWRYSSAAFSHSGVHMSTRARVGKLHSVSASLRGGRRRFASDQGRVWAAVGEMLDGTGTSSPTGAMRDVYVARGNELEAYLQAFELVPGQQGVLVLINGEVVGFDMVSRQNAYKIVHSQLIKSYAMDALLRKTEMDETPSVDKAVRFLSNLPNCDESRVDAVGQGHDYRYQGKQVAGSALVCEQKVIHMAFFKEDGRQAA